MRHDFRNKKPKVRRVAERRIIQYAQPSYVWQGPEDEMRFRAVFLACHEAAKLLCVQQAADELVQRAPTPKHPELVHKITQEES